MEIVADKRNDAKGLPLIRTCQDFVSVCACVRESRSVPVTFEEAKTEHTFEVLKCLGPAKCPLTQKCTRPSSGTPNVTIAIGFLFLPVQFRTPRYTDLHTPLFGDPKWHRSNRAFIFSCSFPEHTDLHTPLFWGPKIAR